MLPLYLAGYTADDSTLAAGQETTIRIWGQGTEDGLYSLAGSIVASGPGDLESVSGSLAWVPGFSYRPGFVPAFGRPGPNGGWADFGSMQVLPSYDPASHYYAKLNLVELASYRIRSAGTGPVTLSFEGGWVRGYMPIETNKSEVLGTLTPVTIGVNPEPTTLALLGLAGLVAVRRRR